MDTIGQAINGLMNTPLPTWSLPWWVGIVITVAIIAAIVYFIAKSLIIVN